MIITIWESIRGSTCGNIVLARNARRGGNSADKGLAGRRRPALHLIFKSFLIRSLSGNSMAIRIRLAEARDIPSLRELIEAAVRGLQTGDYSATQLESALRTVYGVDTQLISDGTYFAAEETESSGAPLLVGCGGWSKRTTLYGGDQFAG